MTHPTPAALLERARRLAAGQQPPPPAQARPTALEAVRQWAAAMPLRTGGYRLPPARYVAELVQAWHAGRGLEVEVSGWHVGKALREYGLEVEARKCGGVLLARREDAELLWAQVRARLPGLRMTQPMRYTPLRTPVPPRRPPKDAPRPLLAERHPSARPLLDSLGRVWPSPAVAARLLGSQRSIIADAARNGHPLLGARWRQLRPEEVALLPADARAGDTVPLCFHAPCLWSGHGHRHEVR